MLHTYYFHEQITEERNCGTIKTEKYVQQKENCRKLGWLKKEAKFCVNFSLKIKKKEYFGSLNAKIANDTKKFLKIIKAYFSNIGL